MKIDILTLFPDMFEGPFGTSMLKKAQDEELVEINIHNLRDWATDKHKSVDDRPYGGGPGMILMVEPIDRALKDLKSKTQMSKSKSRSNVKGLPAGKAGQMSKVILLSAKGKTYNQKKAQKLSKLNHLILIAGHYEGVDERVAEHLVDEEISIGNYVLTGGEIPAMVIVDSVVRLIPGVLKSESLKEESFSKLKNARLPAGQGNSKIENFTEHSQYTRPEVYRGWHVPEVLLSGNHKEIEKWRKSKAGK